MSDNKPVITAYLKTYCGWSEGVRAIMRKHGLDYEEKDIIANPAFRWEMEQQSGQSLSPCVAVNDVMLADVSGDEVEAYMLEKGIVLETDEREATEARRGQREERKRGKNLNMLQWRKLRERSILLND